MRQIVTDKNGNEVYVYIVSTVDEAVENLCELSADELDPKLLKDNIVDEKLFVSGVQEVTKEFVHTNGDNFSHEGCPPNEGQEEINLEIEKKAVGRLVSSGPLEFMPVGGTI